MAQRDFIRCYGAGPSTFTVGGSGVASCGVRESEGSKGVGCCDLGCVARDNRRNICCVALRVAGSKFCGCSACGTVPVRNVVAETIVCTPRNARVTLGKGTIGDAGVVAPATTTNTGRCDCSRCGSSCLFTNSCRVATAGTTKLSCSRATSVDDSGGVFCVTLRISRDTTLCSHTGDTVRALCQKTLRGDVGASRLKVSGSFRNSGFLTILGSTRSRICCAGRGLDISSFRVAGTGYRGTNDSGACVDCGSGNRASVAVSFSCGCALSGGISNASRRGAGANFTAVGFVCRGSTCIVSGVTDHTRFWQRRMVVIRCTGGGVVSVSTTITILVVVVTTFSYGNILSSCGGRRRGYRIFSATAISRKCGMGSCPLSITFAGKGVRRANSVGVLTHQNG